MDPKLLKVIYGLLRYSLEPADWQFEQLTAAEQAIVGDQETLDAIRSLAGTS